MQETPQTTAHANRLTATQGTASDALTSSTVTQSSMKTHFLCKWQWSGTISTTPQFTPTLWTVLELSLQPARAAKPPCSPPPLRLCQPGCWNVPKRYRYMSQRAGIAQRVKHQTRDWKVMGLSPSRSGWRIWFSMVSFLCYFAIWVTAEALKRAQSFCQKCRWQVTAKHTCTLHMRLWMK